MKFQIISTIFVVYVAGANAALPLLIDSYAFFPILLYLSPSFPHPPNSRLTSHRLVNGAHHKRDLDVGTEIPHLKCLSWDGIHCIPTSLPVEAREAEAEAEEAVKVLEMRSFRA
jgi:hypothetical protein